MAFSGVVPMFPLPNVVLLPRGVLPLHMFEPRYCKMTADALAGDQRIAMALLRSGWEPEYHGRPAVHDVVCVGRIIAHELLNDGRYNILLEGVCRAKIVHEQEPDMYRIVECDELESSAVFDIDLEPQRRRLGELIERSALGRTTLGVQLVKLTRSPLSTPDLFDVVSFNLLEDCGCKQAILEEADVLRRIDYALDQLARVLPPGRGGVSPNLN